MRIGQCRTEKAAGEERTLKDAGKTYGATECRSEWVPRVGMADGRPSNHKYLLISSYAVCGWGDENGPLPDEIRFANLRTSTWINVKRRKKMRNPGDLGSPRNIGMVEDHYTWSTIENPQSGTPT